MNPLLVGAALLLSALASGQDSGRGLPAPSALFERGALVEQALARDPADLPQAEPGRWKDFFQAEAQAQIGAQLGRSVLAALAAAEKHYTAADYPAALVVLYAVLEREADLPAAWLLAGACHYRLRRHGDGVTAYTRFLRVAPGEVRRTQALGHCLVGVGRFDEAEAHYLRVLAELPESFESLRGLGVARARAGEFEGALEALDRALGLRPGHTDARQWRGQVLLWLERAEEALAVAVSLIERLPVDPRPRFLQMEALYDLGRGSEAEAIRPVWQRLDRLAQERRALESRLLLEPHQSLWVLELLRLAREAGDVEGAEQAFERLRRSAPDGMGAFELGVLEVETYLVLDPARARTAAERLAVEAAEDPRTWQRMALYWGLLDEPERQQEAAERLRRPEPR
jgi:tetratricopeptide (TPR) repeat protein